MFKWKKYLLGSVFNFALGFVGVMVWVFVMGSVAGIKTSVKEGAIGVFFLSMLLTIIPYFIWSSSKVKDIGKMKKKNASWLLFFMVGLILTVAFAIATILTIYSRMALYVIVTAVCNIIGSLIAYMISKA